MNCREQRGVWCDSCAPTGHPRGFVIRGLGFCDTRRRLIRNLRYSLLSYLPQSSRSRSISPFRQSSTYTTANLVMDSSILPATHYNTDIADFDNHQHTSPSEGELTDLGKIFVQHGHHLRYGVGLLHRHFDLAVGHVMCHETKSIDGCQVDECRPFETDRNPSPQPHSLYLNAEGKLQAFEYAKSNVWSQGPGSAAFFDDVSQHIVERGLQKRISLVPREGTPDDILVETLVPCESMMRTKSRPRQTFSVSDGHAAETTGWAFDEDEGGVIGVTQMAICVVLITGMHERRDG